MDTRFPGRMWAGMLAAVTMLALAGCGEGETAPADEVAEIRITGDDQMRFEPTRFDVRAGQTVRLTLEHIGEMSLEEMGHNVVILVEGEEPQAFGAEATRSGGSLENHYVPEAMRDRVIAFTEMIGGGETAEVTFEAPQQPGVYRFVCTFPGHFGTMTGNMVVE